MKVADQIYGKDRVRVLRVVRDASGQHHVYEVTASVSLQGDFSKAYSSDDNSSVVPTDTMKNTVHILAQKSLGPVIEDFALTLAEHFLKKYAHVTKVTIELIGRPWTRFTAPDGKPHPHAFTAMNDFMPWTHVSMKRDGETAIVSGVKDVLILKSSGSGFVGYPKCDFTTLPETNDRILASSMEATWIFKGVGVNYTKANAVILETLLATFAKEFSPSVQNTIFLMGKATLTAVPEIFEITLSMPNKHYLPINLKPFGIETTNEVFLPTDEPHGQIEATIVRD